MLRIGAGIVHVRASVLFVDVATVEMTEDDWVALVVDALLCDVISAVERQTSREGTFKGEKWWREGQQN